MRIFFSMCCAILVASYADAAALLPSLPLPSAPAVSLLPATRPSRVSAVQWVPRGYHAVRDIAYVPGGGRSRILDIYLPDQKTAPRPLMVWIHGGGWCSGDKALPPGLGLLSRGYVVASINYRLSSEALFPAQIFDCKAAIRFLRAHALEFGVNPDRIGVWGDSAGGQLASLLGTTNGCQQYEGIEGIIGSSSDVQAVCDWFGPSDFLQATDWSGAGGRAVNLLLGGSPLTSSRVARFASPAAQVGRGKLVPFLIMHGDQDRMVPLHQSQELFERLAGAGVSVRLIVVPHSGHGYGWFRNRDDLATVYEFFDRWLLKAQIPKSPLHAKVPATMPSA